jgi:hypothetical protein
LQVEKLNVEYKTFNQKIKTLAPFRDESQAASRGTTLLPVEGLTVASKQNEPDDRQLMPGTAGV